MGDASAQSDMASDALQVLIDQTFANIKLATPVLEDLAKASQKYHSLMEQTQAAAATFIDCLAKVGVVAGRARGATGDLGQGIQKLTNRHNELNTERIKQAKKLNDQFLAPLQKRLKTDSKVFNKMEDDFKSFTKSFKTDLKKAGQHTIKAQKSIRKAKNAQDAQKMLDSTLEALVHKSKSFEAFNQRSLRTVLIEERRRFCYLIDNYASVFHMDYYKEDDNALLRSIVGLCQQPEELPASSQALIEQNSSNGLIYDRKFAIKQENGEEAKLKPSPLTQEYQEALSRARKQQQGDDRLPPGCPPGGLSSVHNISSDQTNPTRSRPKGVPKDVHLANQSSQHR